ncbi:MAG: hypothetical protein ABIP06_10950 [Pyrinomonadaceae bacterium]
MQNQKSALGLDSNITALIAYPVGIVALILVFIEKENKFVRFHAFQSLLFWAAAIALCVALLFVTVFMAFISSTIATLFSTLIGLMWLGVFAGLIFLAYKAYQNEMFKLPIIGDMADKWSN